MFTKKVTTIFNLFITYGDSFLSAASDYDDLFYEMIHQSKILVQFNNIADNTKNCNSLVQLQENITTIIRHFSSKLDQWQEDHPNSTLSEQSVINIIKNNYGSLKLNLFDGLDQFDPYLENPKEVPFFKQFIRMVIYDYRTHLHVNSVQLSI